MEDAGCGSESWHRPMESTPLHSRLFYNALFNAISAELTSVLNSTSTEYFKRGSPAVFEIVGCNRWADSDHVTVNNIDSSICSLHNSIRLFYKESSSMLQLSSVSSLSGKCPWTDSPLDVPEYHQITIGRVPAGS